jgi:hypothetical protein
VRPVKLQTIRNTLLSVSVLSLIMGSVAANAQSNDQQGAQIKVQEQQPQVNVQQPAPEVTVKQPQPQVTVTQPKPEVTVTQPKPQVQVQQAQPSVEVQQEGQPKVTVQEQGQPNVTVQREAQEQHGAQREAQDQGGAQRNQAQPGLSPQALQGIAALQRDQIVGKTLYDRNNKQVGKIDAIQDGPGGSIASAQLDVGGFLGIGAKRVAIPADQLQLQDDRLVTSMTEDQIRNLESVVQRQ